MLDDLDHADRGAAACMWRPPCLPELDCLTARLDTHRYPMHRHDTYVVAIIEQGCEAVTVRGRRLRATPGEIVLINPDELHDGAAEGAGLRYRAFYPPPALMAAVAADMRDDPGAAAPAPGFDRTLVADPALAARLTAAHRRLKDAADPLERDGVLTDALGALIARHGAARPPPAAPTPARVARVAEMIRDEPGRAFPLEELAQAAGLSRFHFLRVFQRATGQTPHAYVVNQRVNLARALLRRGERPAEVAAACGFADQPHLTRAFKRIVGVTPGRYIAACRA